MKIREPSSITSAHWGVGSLSQNADIADAFEGGPPMYEKCLHPPVCKKCLSPPQVWKMFVPPLCEKYACCPKPK